jgi:hypothetical protein
MHELVTVHFGNVSTRLQRITVPVITLNEIVDSGLPEMVKIDAEGFDLKVIGRIVTAWQSASLDSKKLFS